MPRYKRRQRLTERVAARKGTLPRTEEKKPTKRWPGILSQFGFVLTLVSLGLLAYEALQMAESGGNRDITNMVIYVALFIAGRLIKAAVDAAKPYL